MCPWKICDENFNASCEDKEEKEKRLISLTDGKTCNKDVNEKCGDSEGRDGGT